MAALTVSQCLGMLLADPDSQPALEGLLDALTSGDAARIGAGPAALLELARRGHAQRGEVSTAAQILELEITLVEGDPDHEAELWKELARLRRDSLLDDKGAREALEKALALRPGDEDAREQAVQLDQVAGSWKEIGKRLVEEAAGATDPTLRSSVLQRAAALVWQYKKRGRDKEVDALFAEALAVDPSSTAAAALYEQTLRAREKWEDLAKVLVSAAEATKNRDEKLHLFVRAGRVIARKLSQQDRAAACYERVLDFAPGHPEAMSFLVEHFTMREQWDHLVALYEDALRSRQKLDSEQGILLQIGMVHWRMRQRPAEAEPYFARLRKIDPAHPAMLDFYRDFLTQSKDEQRLLTILGDAQRTSGDSGDKLKLAVEVARQAQANPATVDRAIDAWKGVQRLDPQNGEAVAALRELYAKGGKWNALVEVLKAELDLLPPTDAEHRVALLREMVPIYRDKLSLDVMVINTFNAILQFVPDDVDALQALATTYETLGRWNDLILVLTKQADAETDKGKKVALYTRVANLWIERFANYNQATRPLELVFEIDPNNRDALSKLKDIYTKKRAWKPLFDVMRREADLASDPSVRLYNLVELAKLAGERLHKNADALQLWREVLDADANAPGALDALEKLAEREKDFPTLADALERRIAATGDVQERIKLLQKVGSLYSEQMSDDTKSADAWKRVLALEPKNGRAMRTLREAYLAAGDYQSLEALYGDVGDWEGLVEVLGTAADKLQDPALRVKLSFHATDIYAQKIGEPQRAFRAYERVLTADPKNERAARALLAIYEADQKWPRLPALLEIVLGSLPSGPDAPSSAVAERLSTLARLRDLSLGELREPERGFHWALEAYRVAPEDAMVRAGLEMAAERAGAWEPLTAAYLARLAQDDGKAAAADEQRRLRQRIATFAETKLGKPALAVEQLQALVDADANDAESVAGLERMLRAEGRHADLRTLLLARIAHTTDATEQYVVLGELAKLEELTLGDADGAALRYRAMLEIDGSDADALAALDRLATAAGRHQELADVLRLRRDAVKEPAVRSELVFRLGQTLAGPLADAKGALEAFADVLAQLPGHGQAIAALEQIAAVRTDAAGADDVAVRDEALGLLETAYEGTGKYDKLARLLEGRLARTKDEVERRALRLRLAEISSSKLGDAAGAYGALEAAFLDNPTDPDLWDRLASAAEAAKQHESLAAAYSMALETGQLSESDAAELARRIAALYDDVLGRPDAAEPFHKRALAHDALDERAFLALKELYTNRERWDDLQVLYRNRISQTVDATAKYDLLMQVCFLFEELLDDPVLAIRAYQDVLELEPGDEPARAALERLYRRTERWRDLAELLRGELDRSTGDARLERMLQLGELSEHQLSDPATAVDQYEAVVSEQPGNDRSRAALERLLSDAGQRQRIASVLEPLYERRYDWADLTRVLEVQLEAVKDPGSRVALLMRIAEIQEARLNDLDKAFNAFERAVLAEPADSLAREELGRVATIRGQDRQRADVLERAVGLTDSPQLQGELLAEVAAVYFDRLQDADRAESAYERLIAVDPHNPDSVLVASRALEAIHLQKGDQAKLAEDLRRQARFENDAEVRRTLLVRLGALLEESLDDVEGAIAVHDERLGHDPADVDAMLSLERLYERTARWQQLVQILKARDGVATDEGSRREIAKRIAKLYEEKLDDRENAIVAWNDVLASFGQDGETLSALARLYEAAERWSELLETLDMEQELLAKQSAGAEERAASRFRAAELMRTRTNERERAIEVYAEVLDLDPSHLGTIVALEALLGAPEASERIAAAKVLVPRYEGSGAYDKLLAALEVTAEVDDDFEKRRALQRAAEVADVGVQDAARAFQLMGRAVRAGLNDDDLAQMLRELERFAASAERWAEHVALLREIAPEIPDGDLQTETYAKVAILARTRLGDRDLARQYFLKVLEGRPDDGAALDALEEIDEAAGDARGLLETLKRKTELASSPDARLWLLMRQAEICEGRIDDIPAAIDAYEQVLEAADKAEAYDGLERLYTKAERWGDLAALYERKLERKAGSEVSTQFALGKVRMEKLGDTEAALESFRAALAVDGAHAPSIAALSALMAGGEWQAKAAEILEPVFLSTLDWPNVIAALEARLAHEEDLDARKDLLSRLGDYCETHLEDLDGALDTYARLFREDPTDETVWDTMGRLARVLEKPARLAEIFDERLDARGVDDAQMAKLALHAGRLHDEKTGDLARAAKDYGLALRFDPTDRGAFAALEAVYLRQKAPDALLALWREQVDVAPSDELRVALLHKIASTLVSEKRDAEQAIGVYREIVDVQPNDAAAVQALDALLVQLERWQDVADLLRQRIDQAAGTPAEIEFKYRLGEVLATRLGDKTGAIDVYEEITQVAPTHAPTIGALETLVQDEENRLRIIQLLEPIYRAADQWRKLVAVYEAQVPLLDDPFERVRVLAAIAGLHEQKGRDPALAFNAWARAFPLEPGNEAVRAELDRLASVLDAWDDHVTAYEQALAATTDPVVISQLLAMIARVHDEKRGDPRGAIVTYERLLAHDESDPTPLDALEALHTMVGDWRGLVEVLRRKCERSYDPSERGELLRRAGSVLEELLSDRAGAIDAYRRAVSEDDTDEVALESLDRLYALSGDAENLASTLRRRAELSQDPDVRIDSNLRLGVLAEEHLRQPSEATAAYERVLVDRPGDGTAVLALARLYERQGLWTELLENLRLQAGMSEDASVRAQLLYRAGEVLERDLDDVSEAVAMYRESLLIAPRLEAPLAALLRITKLEDHRAAAAEVLEPLLREQGRYDELAELLERTADGTSDNLAKRDELRRLAEVHEQGRGDRTAAFEAYRRALAEDPSDVDIADQLERLAVDLNAWDRVADAFAARASSASDPAHGRALYLRLANVAEVRLGDDARAIEAYRRAAEQSGDDDETLAALDRLYVKLQSANELSDVLERRIQLATDPAASATLSIRLGELKEQHFGDRRGALQAYRDVVDRDPSDSRATTALERLVGDDGLAAEVVEVLDGVYRQTNALEKVAGLYDVRIRLADTSGERVRFLQEAAQLWEQDLGRPDRALEACRRAFELDPRDESLLGELERLAPVVGSWESLRGLIEKVTAEGDLDRSVRRDLHLRAARWYRDALSDAAATEQQLRAAIAADPETPEAHEQLVEVLRVAGREAELVAALRAWAEVEHDDAARRERLREAARLAESALADVATAAACHEAILAIDGSDLTAIDDLTRLREAAERWDDVVSLLGRRIDAEPDPDARIRSRHRVGQILRDKLGKLDAAITAYRGVLDELPSDTDAMSALEAIYEGRSAWEDLREILERRLDAAETPAQRNAARVRLARLMEKSFGKRAEAMAQLQEILGEDPTNGEALDELERLYGVDGRFADVVELLERRIGDAASAGDSAGEISALGRLAEVQEKSLRDSAKAVDAYERILERRSDDDRALVSLVRLHEAAKDYVRTAEALERLLNLRSGADLVEGAHRLAELAETQLGDPARAEAALLRALEAANAPDTRERLKKFYEKHGRFDRLAELLAQELEGVTEAAARGALLKRIASIYETKLADPGRAATYFEQAVQLTPEDRGVLLPLCDLYVAAGRAGDAVPVLEKIIASFGGKRVKEVAQYHHRLGLALEGLGDQQAALTHLDAAFKIDLTSVPVLRDLGRLTHALGDFDRAQKTFRALLLQKLDANSGITKGDVYFFLGDICAKQGDKPKAISMLERALAEDKSNQRAAELLATLKA
jgi:tetratricopeptide (TPR) repeat protein